MSAVATIQQDAPPPPVEARKAQEVPTGASAVQALFSAETAPKISREITAHAGKMAAKLGNAEQITMRDATRARTGFEAYMVMHITAKLGGKELAGKHPVPHATYVNNGNEAKELRRTTYETDLTQRMLVSRMDAHRKLNNYVALLREDATVELSPERPVAFHHDHCESCQGHGRLTCDGCSGNGRVPCPSYNCLYGKSHCHYCGGSGSVRGGNNNFVRCNSCGGDGRTNCTTCWGAQAVNCRGCNGHGHLTCTPCRQTGIITHIWSYTLNLSRKVVVDTKVKSCSREIEAWVRAGFPGSVDRDATGDEPVARISSAKFVPHAVPGTTVPAFVYTITGSLAEGYASGQAAGVEYKGWAVALDRTAFQFLSFLDPVFARIVTQAETLSSKTPRDFIAGLRAVAPVLAHALDTGRRSTAGTGVRLIQDELGGTVDVEQVKRLEAAYAKSVASYGASAMRKAWKWPLRIVAGAAVAGVAMDLPWVAYHPAAMPTFMLAAGAAAFVGVTGMVAETWARMAVSKETGSAAGVRPDRRRRRIAAGIGGAFIASCFVPFFQNETPPVQAAADGLRAATHEFREIVGLPHLPCQAPRDPVVSWACLIDQ